jgi:branched-chain amino acid transport system ATP-binding protein
MTGPSEARGDTPEARSARNSEARDGRNTMTGLDVRNLEVQRGGSPVVTGVDLSVPPGEITVVLGPNGAGKTTLLEALSGRIPAQRGTAMLDGVDLLRMSRRARATRGLAHVEQGRTVFDDLTVTENLLVGARHGAIGPAFDMFPELRRRAGVVARALSGGEQQMLVLARAMVGRPRVLLIDEMSLGLAPMIVRRLLPAVRALADDGVAVLLVEQYATLALSVGTAAMVLFRGRIVLRDSAAELSRHTDRLHRAYLGANGAPPGPDAPPVNAEEPI